MARSIRNTIAALTFSLSIACSRSALPPGAIDSGTTDARIIDSSVNPDLSQSIGVVCGSSNCDTRQGNVCCESVPPQCTTVPCAQGTQSTGCDGPEDCAPDQTCCLSVGALFGTSCVASCGTSGDQRGRVCHSAADCAPGQQCLQLELAGDLKGCVGN